MSDFREEIPERYRIDYDNQRGCFFILDTWHESVKNIPIGKGSELPDNSPALKVVTTLEVNALLGRLKEMGWLDKLFSGTTPDMNLTARPVQKTVPEVAIENISKVTVEGKNDATVKEAIMAIREITNKLNGGF